MKMFTGCGERALLSAWKIIKSLLIGMRSKNHRYHHYYRRHHIRFAYILHISSKKSCTTRSCAWLRDLEKIELVILDARILENFNSRSLTRQAPLRYAQIFPNTRTRINYYIRFIYTRVPHIRDKSTTPARFASALLRLLRIKNVRLYSAC